MSVLIKVVVGIIGSCSFISLAIGTDDLMPFGLENGDTLAVRGDDDFDEVYLKHPFLISGTYERKLFLNTNGVISLGKAYTYSFGYCTGTGEYQSKKVLIFWADASTELYLYGNIYFRQTFDKIELKKVSDYLLPISDSDVDNADNPIYELKWAFIATWHNVTYFEAKINDRSLEEGPVPVNTFQAILAANDKFSYTIFLYNKITWIGTGSRIATIGFDFGEQKYYLQESCNEAMIGLEGRSNINRPGIYAFRVDGLQIQSDLTDFAYRCSQNGRIVRNKILEETCTCNEGWQGTYCESRKPVLHVCDWQEKSQAYFASDNNEFVVKSIPNPLCKKLIGTRGCNCHDEKTYLTKWYFSYKCILECNNNLSPSEDMITLTEVYCDFSSDNTPEINIGSVSWSAECRCPNESFHPLILISLPTTNYSTMLLEYNNLRCADPTATYESAKFAFALENCARNSSICDLYATCVHSSSSFGECVCMDGFTGNGFDCQKLCEISNNSDTLIFSTSNVPTLGTVKIISEVDNITMHCPSGDKELSCRCDGNIIGEQDCEN